MIISEPRSCKKCGDDFTTMELELIPSTHRFCHMCWVRIPDHIPHDQKLRFLEMSAI